MSPEDRGEDCICPTQGTMGVDASNMQETLDVLEVMRDSAKLYNQNPARWMANVQQVNHNCRVRTQTEQPQGSQMSK